MTMFMLLPALLLSGQSASAIHAKLSEPIVQVGLFSYHDDGTPAGSAFGTADPLGSTVFASGSLCQLGAGYRDLPAMAAHAWKFTGRVISATAESAVVQLEWQRLMNQGETVTDVPRSVELTLKAGDRVLLDSAAPQSARRCSVTGVGFEARYLARAAGLTNLLPPNGAGAGGGIGRSGVATGPVSGGTSGSRAGGGGTATYTARGRAGRGDNNDGPADPDALRVELWLVHSVPGTEDQTLYQALRATREGAMFAFAPVSVATSQGPVGIQVTGSFAVEGGPAGDRLIFITSRRLSLSSMMPRDRTSDVEGRSRIVRPMPGADDVLSFELPAFSAGGGEPDVRDRFAVRVRIRPAGATPDQ